MKRKIIRNEETTTSKQVKPTDINFILALDTSRNSIFYLNRRTYKYIRIILGKYLFLNINYNSYNLILIYEIVIRLPSIL